MIKVLSLDLWDTLIHTERGPLEPYAIMEIEAITRVLSRKKRVSFDEVKNAYLRLMEYRGVLKPSTHAKLIAGLLGINPEDSILDEVVEAYEMAGTAYTPRLVSGALELLEYAKSRGLRIVVITNTHFSERALHVMLERTGLLQYIDLIISSADYEVLKPNPRIFNIALEKLGVEPGEVVHIGDSCKRDVLGAYVSGIKPILLARRRESIEACREIPGLVVVHDLLEAIDVLRSLLGEQK